MKKFGTDSMYLTADDTAWYLGANDFTLDVWYTTTQTKESKMPDYGNVGLAQEAPMPAVASPTQDVIINKVSNGFVVRIGCKVLVAKEWSEVSEGLGMYFKDPEAARRKYCQDDILRDKQTKEKIRDLSRNRPRKIGSRRKAAR